MPRSTPSMQALLAFSNAARHHSFTWAAIAMNMTQGAVSRQIAALEALVRVPLFLRHGTGLTLTPEGSAYLPRVEAAIRAIEAATLDLQAFRGRRNHINLACPPSFASLWLMPRLMRFKAQFPDITLNLLPPVWLDPMPPDVDVAIRFGDGLWPELRIRYLFGRECVVVGAAGDGPTKTATKARHAPDWASTTLLHHAQVPDAWPEAIAQLGLADTVNGYAGPRFAQYATLLNAAAAGFGIALVPEFLAHDECAAGRVRDCLGKSIQMTKGYYACTARSGSEAFAQQALLEWMIREAGVASRDATPRRDDRAGG